MHRRVITVGKDLETELNHAADRVLDRPFFIRESAQIVGIGRHHGKRDAPIRGALSELRIVCNRVAVVDSLTLEEIHGGFPVLPLGLTIFFWAFFKHAKVGLVEITLFSFALAFIAETIRRRDVKAAMKDVSTFFNGMGDGFSKVVVLIVAASTMVAGLKAMGLIDAISGLVTGVENAGAGLMLVFSGITALITFVSGSGNAVFYSFIELIPQIADKAGIDPIMVALPMQLTSNVIRAASPVAAVVIIVAAVVKVNPLMVVKRTCVPLLSGFAAVLLLSLIRYA